MRHATKAILDHHEGRNFQSELCRVPMPSDLRSVDINTKKNGAQIFFLAKVRRRSRKAVKPSFSNHDNPAEPHSLSQRRINERSHQINCKNLEIDFSGMRPWVSVQ